MQATSQHILIVDDDPDCLRLLGSLLAQENYRIHAANSGERALEIVGKIDGQFHLDLILLDILMPKGLDGLEICRRLKAHPATCDTPVVFLTGKQDSVTVVQAFAVGGADFVPKPFDAQVLLARVRTHALIGQMARTQELALAERTRELREANGMLKRLAMEISQIEARERERLANDLHDSPMQKLAFAQAQIVSASRHRDQESDSMLEAGLELMRDALQELRSLQFELSPPILRGEGLAAALDWLATHFSQRFGVTIVFNESGDSSRLNYDMAVVLFRCAWELMHNVIKHAQASLGRIELHVTDCEAWLIVSDDGQGCPAIEVMPNSTERGFGLFSIRERLYLLGGRLTVDHPAQGSRFKLWIPLPTAVNPMNRRASDRPFSQR